MYTIGFVYILRIGAITLMRKLINSLLQHYAEVITQNQINSGAEFLYPDLLPIVINGNEESHLAMQNMPDVIREICKK